MNKFICLLAVILLSGCGNRETPALQPAVPATTPTNTAALQPPPAGQSFGSAAVDVITQRYKVETGRKAKAEINAAADKENKELDAVLNE